MFEVVKDEKIQKGRYGYGTLQRTTALRTLAVYDKLYSSAVVGIAVLFSIIYHVLGP